MDPILEELRQLREIVEENQKVLKKLHTAAVWARVMRAVYIGIIVLVGFGMFIYLQPYLDTLLGVYGQFGDLQSNGIQLPFDLPEGVDTADLLKSLQQ